MAGLEDEGVAGGVEGGKSAIPIDPARAFDRQPVWKRTIVILAGVTMNAVFAFLIYSGLAATAGAPELASTEIDSVAPHSLPPGTEALAGLKFGDRIVRVNGDTVRSWNALLDHILAGPTTQRFEVAGRPEPVVVHLSDGGLATRQALAQALTRLDPPRLGLVEPGRPAIRAGLRPGDLGPGRGGAGVLEGTGAPPDLVPRGRGHHYGRPDLGASRAPRSRLAPHLRGVLFDQPGHPESAAHSDSGRRPADVPHRRSGARKAIVARAADPAQQRRVLPAGRHHGASAHQRCHPDSPPLRRASRRTWRAA